MLLYPVNKPFSSGPRKIAVHPDEQALPSFPERDLNCHQKVDYQASISRYSTIIIYNKN